MAEMATSEKQIVQHSSSSASNAKRVGLIFGGVGPEHEASLASARSVLDALSQSHYEVRQLGISKQGSWLVGDGAWSSLYKLANSRLLPSAIRHLPAGMTKSLRTFDTYPDSGVFTDLDCVFPLVDGVGGEDGSLQGFLSIAGVPSVGCSLLPSAQAYDKWTTKRLARAAGLPVVNGVYIRRGERRSTIEERIASDIGHCNVIVKPSACGSSFGVSHVRDTLHLHRAIAVARRYSPNVLIEEYVENRELFVAALSRATQLIVSPPVIDSPRKRRHSTYFDKYISDKSFLKYPTDLGKDVEERATALAEQVYRCLGCDGFARIDLFYRTRDKTIVLNEVNTIPAFAPDCAFSAGMDAAGLPYEELLDAVIATAFAKPSANRAQQRTQSTDATHSSRAE